ncbi:MAG: XrtV sorting system accessory protein [Pseudomonadota bacterium]
MSTVFDVFAMCLIVVSLAIFIIRYIREEPPILPYLLIAIACGVGNWVGETVDQFAGIVVLIIAAFLFLSCFLYPDAYYRKPDQPEFE